MVSAVEGHNSSQQVVIGAYIIAVKGNSAEFCNDQAF